MTAYVEGEQADNYDFTSALSVQLLKVLEPELRPLIKGKEPVQQAMIGSSQAPVSNAPVSQAAVSPAPVSNAPGAAKEAGR